MNFDLFDSIPSGEQAFRRRYWEQKNKNPDPVTKWTKDVNRGTVEVVLQKDKPDQEKVKDFYNAQRELAKNTLPEQCKSATVELSEMQLRNENEFSDQAFKQQTTLGGEYNPKEPFVNFKKKENEMEVDPASAFQKIYPFPFGREIPTNVNLKPMDKGVGSEPQDTFQEMQKDNQVDYIGDHYLPKSTQDGKHDTYLPPQYQLSSANQNTEFGCLMAMIPEAYASHFTDFAKKHIDSNTLHKKGFEDEPHITACYGFNDRFDSSKLEKMLGGTGPIKFTVGEVSRFEHPDYDVLHFKVHSPDLEMINAKVSREFAGELDNPNQKYNPHITLAYVKKGTNKHLDGQEIKKTNFGASRLLYSGPNKTKRHIVSLAWDAIKMDDGGFEDGIGSKQQDEKPLNSIGDAFQDFLINRSKAKKKENEDLYAELEKPFGHEKQV